MNLDNYLESIKTIFSENERYQAHKKALPLLVEMSKDKQVWFGIIKKNLIQPSFLQKIRHHPIIAFTIEENTDISFIAHCYLPLPTRDTNISHQSIHHHGNLLLTTVSAFGEGYESILFKKGYHLDKYTGKTEMQIDKVYKNQPHNIEFIDAHTPHIVFFPADLSVTYALWSTNKKYGTEKLKKHPVLQKFKKPIIKLMNATGISSLLGVNVVEYFDFYPQHKEIIALKERIFGYKPGSNSNFLQNIFYIMQKTGFDDYSFISQLKTQCVQQGNQEALKWIDCFLQKKSIPDLFEPQHLNIDKVNIKKEQVLSVFN